MVRQQRSAFRPSFRPVLEELEDRRVLAVGIVDRIVPVVAAAASTVGGGLLVSPKTGLIIDESTFGAVSVQLSSAPRANVKIKIASERTADATVAPKTLIFTPANWNIAQSFNIKGVNKDIGEPRLEKVRINLAAASADRRYAGDKAAVTVRIRDLGKAAFNGLYFGSLTATGRIPLTGHEGTIQQDLEIQVINGRMQVLKPTTAEIKPIAGSDTFKLNQNGTASLSFKVQATQSGVSVTILITATGRKLADGSIVFQGALKSLTPAVVTIFNSFFELKTSAHT